MAGTTEGRDTGPGIRLQGPRKRGGEASTPGRGSKGSGWHHMAPPGETAKPRGRDDQACPPHLRPRSITGRRARGRQDVTCADQAPAPIQLRGGNALSHSYERSSLLEGRRRAQSHTIPRLSATRAGVGRWVPEAWGPQQSPPAREPAPRHTVYLGPQAGKGGWDLTPNPRQSSTGWWVSLPGLGNPCAPAWFWNQLPLKPLPKATLPPRGADSGPGPFTSSPHSPAEGSPHSRRHRVRTGNPSRAPWHQSKNSSRQPQMRTWRFRGPPATALPHPWARTKGLALLMSTLMGTREASAFTPLHRCAAQAWRGDTVPQVTHRQRAECRPQLGL